jgi:hypothetical protein
MISEARLVTQADLAAALPTAMPKRYQQYWNRPSPAKDADAIFAALPAAAPASASAEADGSAEGLREALKITLLDFGYDVPGNMPDRLAKYALDRFAAIARQDEADALALLREVDALSSHLIWESGLGDRIRAVLARHESAGLPQSEWEPDDELAAEPVAPLHFHQGRVGGGSAERYACHEFHARHESEPQP